MAEQCGQQAPDAATADWSDVKQRARRWQRAGAIKERAEKSNRLTLYNYSYRHGSSFEHSDAWSLLTFDRANAWARDVILHLALLVTAHALAMSLESWANYFGIEDRDAEKAVTSQFLAAFPEPKAH